MTGITLRQAQEDSARAQNRTAKVITVADVTTADERRTMAERRREVTLKRRKFNDFDSLTAEMIARFGYQTYLAWKSNQISTEQMTKWLYAERAREALAESRLHGTIMALVGDCIRWSGKGEKPNGKRIAAKILNGIIKTAKGED